MEDNCKCKEIENPPFRLYSELCEECKKRVDLWTKKGVKE